MKKLEQEMKKFFDELYEGEQKVLVFGQGNPSASLMLVGEAPGEQEALQGRPFVGKAGKNLDAFLELSGFHRDDLYITNTVKFRPVKLSAAGRYVNRPPNREEIELFLPWLIREIEQINPKCIVTLGNVPLKALLGRAATIGEMHGEFVTWQNRLYYPMYHPASLIYNPSLHTTYQTDIEKLARWREEYKRNAENH